MNFFPLPDSVAEQLGNRLVFQGACSAVDPCAGEGRALLALTRHALTCRRYGIELDAYRAEEAATTLDVVIQGDALNTRTKVESFSLVYCNPPFDFEQGDQGGNQRMEKLFTARVARWLVPAGILVLVIPLNALRIALARSRTTSRTCMCSAWIRRNANGKNTRLVRLPDRYYSFFRDALHPALRCFFVVDYNIGRRKDQLLRTQWKQVNFDERHIFFPSTKSYPHNVKAPFFGEMEAYLRQQLALRNHLYPDCPWVFFGFDLRSDKNGKRIEHFGGLWSEAVATPNARLKSDGRDPIDLHVHDLRRSAHYQMRKAGIDSKTRRAIMGHKTGSMDDRYTVIDDEAFEDAIDKMNAYQKRQGMISELKELAARVESLSDAEFQRFIALRQKIARTKSSATA
jgi:integrase